MEEGLDVGYIEPVFAAPADAVGFEYTDLGPEPDGIGVYVQQMGNLGHPEEPWRQRVINIVKIFKHMVTLDA